jgi:hypothetical protein
MSSQDVMEILIYYFFLTFALSAQITRLSCTPPKTLGCERQELPR